jgi:hypothetical protein
MSVKRPFQVAEPSRPRAKEVMSTSAQELYIKANLKVVSDMEKGRCLGKTEPNFQENGTMAMLQVTENFSMQMEMFIRVIGSILGPMETGSIPTPTEPPMKETGNMISSQARAKRPG